MGAPGRESAESCFATFACQRTALARIFVFCDNDGNKSLSITIKLPHSGDEAIEMDQCEMTGYGLGKAGWITARFTKQDKIDVAMLKGWIDESYRAIAPKTLVKKLT